MVCEDANASSWDKNAESADQHQPTRRPYVITKQRGRWTPEEHQRFLDALRIFGRRWRKAEEYIGTKTAVQIASHAQKFFTKIERDGVVAGESLPAMVPDETVVAVPERYGTVPCDLYPTQDPVVDVAVPVPSVNGKVGEARAVDPETEARVRFAQALAVQAEAKSKAALTKAQAADALAVEAVGLARAMAAIKVRVANAEADAKVRIAEAEAVQAATKVRMATAEALEVDLKIVKLRKELEVLTGESEGQGVVVCFCLAVRLSACLSLPVFLTRTLCCFRILCSPPFSFCFSHRFAA